MGGLAALLGCFLQQLKHTESAIRPRELPQRIFASVSKVSGEVGNIKGLRHAAIKALQSSRMSNPTFTDDNEWRPQGGVCVASRPGVDHRHHGLPVGLGTGETGLSRCKLENRLRRHVDQFCSAVDRRGVNLSDV